MNKEDGDDHGEIVDIMLTMTRRIFITMFLRFIV